MTMTGALAEPSAPSATPGAGRFARTQVAAGSSLAEDVLDGLSRPFKELPPKHLYDERGSQLFEQICELPEYYPTRTERAILETHADQIVAGSLARELLELGSGAATKTCLLLDAMHGAGLGQVRYLPVDISASAMERAVAELAARYPAMLVDPIVGEFEDAWLDEPRAARLVAFLGGTLGNLLPGARRRFLRQLAGHLGGGGHALIGVDLVKDRGELIAAYDDAAGVTAAFNLNILAVLNQRLGAEFDLDNFEHVALYDDDRDWIEMRLRAREACTVVVGELGLSVSFAAGEEMRTEISAKFTRERIQEDLVACGLAERGWFTDPDERFALVLCNAI